jgi:hypothetical protein
MNQNLNENGFVIVIAICVLGLLTIIGVSSLQISMTEMKISANQYIHEKNFYAADSGYSVAPIWLKANLPESEYTNIDWKGIFDLSIGNINHLDVEIVHATAIDGGVEKVILYGDENGDYLNEANFTVGVPLAIVNSTGTCTTRSGNVKIESRHIWESVLMMPDAALRINANVDGNGVSGSIIGEPKAGSSC